MKQSYRVGLIALAVAGMFGTHASAATEAEERAKRQLALLQQKLEALQQGISEQDKALRDANRRNAELMHELNSARTVIRWIGNNPAAVKKIGAEAVGEEKPAAAATEAAPAVTDAATDAVAAGSEPAKPSEEKPKAIGTPVVSKPPKPPKPVAPVVTETASLPPPFTDPLYLGGGAAVVGGAAVWALMRRRRKDSAPMFEDSLLAHNPPTKHVVIGSTGGAVIDTTLAMNSMLKDEDLGDGSFDPSTIDPVAEAEVYLAYGRDSQAEEILQDALSKLPNRQDIRLKLLEIYASRGDLRSFETTLAEMQSIGVNKDDSIWMRVVELSAGFGPKNPLAGEPDDELHQSVTAGPAQALPVQTRPEPDNFELALLSGAAAETTAAAVAEGHGHDSSIGHELNLLQPDTDAADVPLTDVVDLSAPADDEPARGTMSQEPAAAELPSGSQRINPDTLLNFDFEFDSNADRAPVADSGYEDDSAAPAAPEVLLDFGGINLDLDAEMPAQMPDTAAEPVITLEIDNLQAEDEDPIDIKISLAKAYMEMGDRDSANEILQEVLDEGNATQGKLAREMLEEMRSAA